MSSFTYQNWEKTVLTKSAVKPKRYPRTEKKSVDNFDPEHQTNTTVSNKTLASAIQKARAEKKMSQSDLDRKCNFPKNTVRNYENCKAVVKPNELNKLNRVLNVKLPRPKKVKKVKS